MSSKSFIMTFNTGQEIWVASPCNQKQKSYDLLVSSGDNMYYKVGVVKDINKLREVLKISTNPEKS